MAQISVNDESEDRDKFSKLKFGGEEQQNDLDKRGPTNVKAKSILAPYIHTYIHT